MRLRTLSTATTFGLLASFLIPPGASGASRAALGNGAIVTEAGIWGGGFINVIAKNPRKQSPKFVIGGDTSGLHVSLDAGESWATANTGLDHLDQTTIASVAYRGIGHDNEVYAAFGDGTAADSGIVHSSDGGLSWIPIDVTGDVIPNFNGHTVGGAAAYQFESSPRATGQLLALDEPGGNLAHIYAGTFGTGVMRSDDGGTTWTRVALGGDDTDPNCNFTTPNGDAHGCFVTSLLLSRLRGETDTLYVAVHGGDAANCIGNGICGGVFKITNAACTGNGCADATTTRIEGTPITPVNAEELTFVKSTLMCACGTEGFYAKGRAAATMVQRSSGLSFDLVAGTSYPAIAASPGLIVLGAFNPACEVISLGPTCHTVYQSVDQGLTWTDLVFDQPAGNIDFTVAGTDIEWWESSQTKGMIDGPNFNAAQIALTGGASPQILVAGHSGIWKTTNPDHVHWQPAVQGIGATTTLDVAADSNHAGYVYEGLKDWEAFASSSNFDPGTAFQTRTPFSEMPASTSAFSVTVDLHDEAVPSAVYMAGGVTGPPPNTNVGRVYSNPDPTTGSWTNLSFATDGTCGSRTTPRVTGLGVQHPDPTASATVFAATDGCGLYRFRNGRWGRVGSTTDMFSIEDFFFNYAPISVPNSLGAVAYALDRKTGKLWRTENGGTVWNGPIFTIPTGERDFNSGWMVADPNAQGISVVWLATNSATGLHELTCVASCQIAANWTDSNVTTVANPGPIAIPPCVQPCTSVVYVGARVQEGDPTPAALYKSTPGGTFCDVTVGLRLWAGAAGFPVQLTASEDGLGAVTGSLITVGNGTLTFTDPSGPDCESARGGP